MILISYCVMLTPYQKYVFPPMFPIALGLLLSHAMWYHNPAGAIPFGLLYSASAILLVSFLLYLVMLSVVEIIDYSVGIIKF